MKKPKDYVEHVISRRSYLTFKVMMETECNFMMATEAVASTAIEHPEWDLEETKTWAEWEGGTR